MKILKTVIAAVLIILALILAVQTFVTEARDARHRAYIQKRLEQLPTRSK